MNIILIVVDALRPDHLSINGYNRNTSPNIDKFAKEGTIFLNAYASLPNSDPSVTSILTGMYPHSHGVRMLFNNKLKPSISTLPGILKSHGYKTAYMKCGSTYKFGLESGFDEYDLLGWKIKNKIKRGVYKILHQQNYLDVTQQYTDLAIKWIKKNASKNFFLFIHYINLHWPYKSPKPFDHMFDADYKGKHLFNTLVEENKISRGEMIFGLKKLPKEEVEHAIAHYDGGLKYIDFNIGKLLNFLKDKDLDDKTLIVITSDHGESFGEHEYYFQHGSHLYEDGIKVPIIFNNPAIIPKGKKIKDMVQNLDIMPTALNLLNIPLIDNLDGVNMLPLIEGKKDKARDFVFAESVENYWKENKRMFFEGVEGKWRAMIFNDWKIILIPNPKDNIYELYNLKDDPQEKNNLIDKEKEIASKMKKRLLEFLKEQSIEGEANLSDLTERSKKLLKDLGYIG